jgi:hypothetical protein
MRFRISTCHPCILNSRDKSWLVLNNAYVYIPKIMIRGSYMHGIGRCGRRWTKSGVIAIDQT